MSEVEETVKRIQGHKGVVGIIVINSEGACVYVCVCFFFLVLSWQPLLSSIVRVACAVVFGAHAFVSDCDGHWGEREERCMRPCPFADMSCADKMVSRRNPDQNDLGQRADGAVCSVDDAVDGEGTKHRARLGPAGMEREGERGRKRESVC